MGERIRVVHVITRLEWGGAQENTLFTVGALDRKRFEPVLVSGVGGLLDGRAGTIPGCRWFPVPSLVRDLRPIADVRAVLALRRLFREIKAESPAPLIVHTHSSKAGILGRAAARMAGADVVIHSIHGFGFHGGQTPALRSLYVGLERMAAGRTDAFIAVSEENIRTGVLEGIFGPERCRLIRSGFDTRRFLLGERARGRGLLGIPEGVPVVGTVAVFKSQKAPLDFVAVARRLAGEVPEARFVMVGDGEERPAVEKAIREAGLSERFVLAGWREEVPDLLRAFDVFLLTSRWEGLPKVVPQALIAGIPVVATAVDGTSEIVDDGIDGFLAPPGDIESLSDRVAAVIRGDSGLRPGFKREALIRAFDQDEMVRDQEKLYNELLDKKGIGG
ncbi:MAG TPA: glycosyltransferase [Candidatus Deferrimicrobiaceae bacterium]